MLVATTYIPSVLVVKQVELHRWFVYTNLPPRSKAQALAIKDRLRLLRNGEIILPTQLEYVSVPAKDEATV
jgi:hypothetical protein